MSNIIPGFDFNIRTDKPLYLSQCIEIDNEISDVEQLSSIYYLSESQFFKSSIPEPYLMIFRKIESFLSLEKNWDGNDAIPVTKKVVEQSKKIIEHLNNSFTTNIKTSNISASPYSTIIIDWENEKGTELSLEIGNEAIGYYFENENNYKEVETLNINNSTDFGKTLNFLEEDLSMLY